MSDVMPQEDDITRTQLWERIDSTRAAFESHKGEILTRIDSVVTDLKSQLDTANSEHTVIVYKKLGEVKDWLSQQKTDQTLLLTQAIKDIQSLFNTHLADIEKRLKEMNDSIEFTVKAESNDLFLEDQKRIQVVEEKFASLDKGLNEALSNFQIETRTKVGGLRSRVENIISKLRDGFQDL